MLLKIGELAKRTGLTVRTLHHYDAIKLLCPSGRSPSGYRLYNRDDIERLHRIQALRRLDLPLADIAALLAGDAADLQTVLGQQIVALDQQMARATDLRRRLALLRERIREHEEPDLDDWLSTLAMMNVYDKYFTADELEQLRQNAMPVNAEFNALRKRLREAMEGGVAPDSPEVLALARDWIRVTTRTLAADARLIYKVDTLHRSESDVRALSGIDGPLLDYITRATAEYRFSLYAGYLPQAVLNEVRPRFHAHYLAWPALFAEARELVERGADPLDPAALALAARWIELFAAVWGQDPALHQQVRAAHASAPEHFNAMSTDNRCIQMVSASIEYLKKQQENA
jgi:DNA-binding transcriptional MerR regulator